MRSSALCCLFVLAACGDDIVNRQRPPTGTPDAGAYAPLPLEVGDHFEWRAQLNHRGTAAQDEGDAIFTLAMTLTAVKDEGPGLSRITVVAAGSNMLDRDWNDVRDFDPFVARVGPARSSDAVDGSEAVLNLDDFPEMPAARRPGADKVLPNPELFFIDVRDAEALRNAFVERYADRSPRVVAPDDSGTGFWQFSFEGEDDSVSAFYDPHLRRELTLQYDAKGFLRSISEVVGPESASEAPRATGNLSLTP